MPRGPAPTPKAILDARGSWRGKARSGEPQPEVKIPACPSFLDATARAEWRRITPLLAELGVVSLIDRAELASYCVAWSKFVQIEKLISEKKIGDKGTFKLLFESDRASARLSRLAAQFGLTPASRARVRTNAESKDGDAEEKKKGRFFRANAG